MAAIGYTEDSLMSTNMWNDSILENQSAIMDQSGLVSSSMESQAVWVIRRIILPIICCFGISGIVLTIIVLSRKNMCTSTNCYLLALSLADLLFLLILASTLIDNQFEPYTKYYYHFIIYITYSAIFMQIFLLASIWITVMLAVERFIAICKPFLASRFCTVTKARIIIAVIYLLALVCRLSHFWEEQVISVFDTETNTTIQYITGTELSTNQQYIKWHAWLIDCVVTSVIPFVLLLILNTRLIWEVRKSTKYLQSNQMLSGSNAVQKEEIQVTIMLISVIIVFLVCQVPYVLYTAVQSMIYLYNRQPSIIIFRYITIMLLAIKSAINFILYCWFSEKFLLALKKVLNLERCLSKLSRRRESHISFSASTTRDSII